MKALIKTCKQDGDENLSKLSEKITEAIIRKVFNDHVVDNLYISHDVPSWDFDPRYDVLTLIGFSSTEEEEFEQTLDEKEFKDFLFSEFNAKLSLPILDKIRPEYLLEADNFTAFDIDDGIKNYEVLKKQRTVELMYIDSSGRKGIRYKVDTNAIILQKGVKYFYHDSSEETSYSNDPYSSIRDGAHVTILDKTFSLFTDEEKRAAIDFYFENQKEIKELFTAEISKDFDISFNSTKPNLDSWEEEDHVVPLDVIVKQLKEKLEFLTIS